MSDTFDHLYDAMESMEQAYLWGEIEPTESSEPNQKRCNYCGTFPLYWGNTQDGWRLFTKSDEKHICKNKKGWWNK